MSLFSNVQLIGIDVQLMCSIVQVHIRQMSMQHGLWLDLPWILTANVLVSGKHMSFTLSHLCWSTYCVLACVGQQRGIRLSIKQNFPHFGSVAHHTHLCFQARMSDESKLAPHPRLQGIT